MRLYCRVSAVALFALFMAVNFTAHLHGVLASALGFAVGACAVCTWIYAPPARRRAQDRPRYDTSIWWRP